MPRQDMCDASAWLRTARDRPWIKPLYVCVVTLIVCLWILLVVVQEPGDGLGTDYYPIYRAGQVLRSGGNPYSATEIEHYKSVWPAPFAAAGFVYPLPVATAAWPLSWLPLPAAICLWLSIGVAGSVSAVWLHPRWRELVLLPVLFMPFHRAIIMKQATLVWFAIAVILIYAMRRNRSGIAGFCIALLPAKPQVGLLFALAGLIWAARQNRRALAWAMVWGIAVYGLSFLLLPHWISDWAASARAYARLVHPVILLPWSLVLVAASWRLPWYARVGAAQVALFPASDLYSALPLLLTWVGVGGFLAMLGTSVSWIWSIAGLPNTTVVFWQLVLMPATVCAALRWYRLHRGGPVDRSGREPEHS